MLLLTEAVRGPRTQTINNRTFQVARGEVVYPIYTLARDLKTTMRPLRRAVESLRRSALIDVELIDAKNNLQITRFRLPGLYLELSNETESNEEAA
jgi:hypothetical protein